MRLIFFSIVALVLVFICVILYRNDQSYKNIKNSTKDTIKYISLGDSYTIGEGVKENQRWPNLLEKDLMSSNVNISLVSNPSKTGWTTQNLIDNELPIFDKAQPDFVTLLIGVNDWVQGVDKNTFSNNLKSILDHIQKNISNKKYVVLVTIPDFGVTPTGMQYSGGRNISQGIEEFNNIIINEANSRELKYVDIFGLSQEMKNDPSLINNDGLHPSNKEYLLWEKQILPVVLNVLKHN